VAPSQQRATSASTIYHSEDNGPDDQSATFLQPMNDYGCRMKSCRPRFLSDPDSLMQSPEVPSDCRRPKFSRSTPNSGRRLPQPTALYRHRLVLSGVRQGASVIAPFSKSEPQPALLPFLLLMGRRPLPSHDRSTTADWLVHQILITLDVERGAFPAS
jgi:hypothetical protein